MSLNFIHNGKHYVDFSSEDALAAGVPADVVAAEVLNEKLRVIREKRTVLISNVQFEYERNNRENRLSVESTRTSEWMASLDEYVQSLADITDTDDIDNITWPIKPE